MRGRSCILLGCIVAACIKNHISLTTIPLNSVTETPKLTYQFEKDQAYDHSQLLKQIVLHIIKRTQSETALCTKLLCVACAQCLPVCLLVDEMNHMVPQLLHTFIELDDNFWGVRFEILSMLTSFDYTLLEYYDRKKVSNTTTSSMYASRSITQILVDDIIWKYIADENVRVREQACIALLSVLPHLNGIQEFTDNSTMIMERHTDEYEIRLLKQLSHSLINQSTTDSPIIRDHELLNIATVMRRCIAILNDSKSDKNIFCGVLELIAMIVKIYGYYDENQVHLINPTRSTGSSSSSSQLLSYYCIELLDKMLDTIKFSEVSNDLQVHGLIVDIIGLMTLEMDAVKQDSNGTRTDSILRYLLFMLELIYDLDNYPNSQWSEKPYPFSQTMTRYVYERLFNNVGKSLKSSSDIITQLRSKLLRALYFLIYSGAQSIISLNSDVILKMLQVQIEKDRVNSILCTQQLFVRLFNENQQSLLLDTERTAEQPIIIDHLNLPLFDHVYTYFSVEDDPDMFTNVTVLREKNVKSIPLRATTKNNSVTLRDTAATATNNVNKTLDLFEPIVQSILRAFKYTHSHELQCAVLVMLKRIVTVNIELKRWDKDNTILKHIISLITHMHAYLGDKIPDQTLYHVMDLLSTLYVYNFETIGNDIDEDENSLLNEKGLMNSFTTGLVSNNWDTTIFYELLRPLMITGYLYTFYHPPKHHSQEELQKLQNKSLFVAERESLAVNVDTQSERLSKITLKFFTERITRTETLRVLSSVMKHIALHDPKACQSMTTVLCDKWIKDNELKLLNVDYLNIGSEIAKVFSFIEALSVDQQQQHYMVWSKSIQTVLQTRITGGSMSVQTLFEGLVVLKCLNHFNFSLDTKTVYNQLSKLILSSLSSEQSVPNILLVHLLDQFYHFVSNIIQSDQTASQWLQIESLLSSYLEEPMKLSLSVYTLLISINVRLALVDSAFAKRLLSHLTSQLEKLHKSNTSSKHMRTVFLLATFLPICYLLSQQSSQELLLSYLELMNLDFWSLVMYYEREPITSQFISQLTKVLTHSDNVAVKREELLTSSGLVELIQNRVKQYASRHLYLNDLRKLVRFVKQLPPLRSILNIFINERKRSENSPYFFHKKIYNEIIYYITSKDDHLDTGLEDDTIIIETDSETLAKQLVSSDITSYKSQISTDEKAVAELLSRLSPFSEQSPLKYAPHAIGSMTPASQQAVIDYSNRNKNHDRNRMSDVITCLTSTDQVQVFFNYFYKRLNEEFNNDHCNFTDFAALTTDAIKLIDKHMELTESMNASAVQLEYCNVEHKSQLLKFYCKLIQLFYCERLKENTVDIADVDILLTVSSNIIDFVDYRGSSVDDQTVLKQEWNLFMLHLCTLLIDMTSVTRSSQHTPEQQLLANISSDNVIEPIVERFVKVIIAKIYGVANDEHYGFSIGNIVPFVSQKHIPDIRKISVKICQHYPSLAYRRFLPDGPDSYTRLEDSYVQMLTLMVNEISCNEEMFQKVWSLGFELLEMVSGESSFEEMQLSTLKLLTNMVCILKVVNSQGTTPPVQSGSVRQQALRVLLETVDLYLLKNVKHKQKEKRLYIYVEKDTAIQLFSNFMSHIDQAVQKHRKHNPVFVKEMLKSLTLIMSRNPSMFLLSATATASTTTPNQQYSFKWVYELFKDVYNQSIPDEDWLVRQYAVLGLSKSVSVLSLQDEKFLTFNSQHQQQQQQQLQHEETPLEFIVRVLKDAMVDSHTRLCGNLGILIFIQHRVSKVVSRLVSFVGEHYAKWLLEDNQTIHQLKLQIRLVTSIVSNYSSDARNILDLPRKSMETLLQIADNSRTPLDVVVAVFEALERMLQQNIFNATERKYIDTYTRNALSSKKKLPSTTTGSTSTLEQPPRRSMDKSPSTPQRVSIDIRASPQQQQQHTPTKGLSDLVSRMSLDQRPTGLSPQTTPTKTSIWGGMTKLSSPLSLSSLSSKLSDATKKLTEETTNLANKVQTSLYQSPQSSPQTTPTRQSNMLSRTSIDQRPESSMTKSTSLTSISSPNAMSKSTSMPVISMSATHEEDTRRNSLSKIPVVFTLCNSVTHLTYPSPIQSPISQPLQSQHQNTQSSSSSSSSSSSGFDIGFSLDSLQLTSTSPQQQMQQDCLPRKLSQTQHKTLSRNSQTRQVLLLGLMATIVYSSSTTLDTEYVRSKVMTMFEQLRECEMNRCAEVLLKYTPKLLGDYFDPEQILPLIYNEYLGPKTRPAVLTLSLSAHLPGAFIKDLSNADNPFFKFGQWVKLGMETIAMKRPLSLSIYGLLNMFISACLCDGHHHHSSFIEIGSVVPQTPTDPVFSQSFLFYGICFYSFLKNHIPDQVPVLNKVLDQLLNIETKESEQWKVCITALKQLMEQYDQVINEQDTVTVPTTVNQEAQLLDLF
jgi:hypothetical protein